MDLKMFSLRGYPSNFYTNHWQIICVIFASVLTTISCFNKNVEMFHNCFGSFVVIKFRSLSFKRATFYSRFIDYMQQPFTVRTPSYLLQDWILHHNGCKNWRSFLGACHIGKNETRACLFLFIIIFFFLLYFKIGQPIFLYSSHS